jgi:putative flippase GtrA
MNYTNIPLFRLARFGIVGGLNTAISYCAFAILLRIGFHYILATLMASILGMFLGFKLHGHFVFNNSGKGRFLHFATIFLIMFTLSIGIQTASRLVVNGYIAGAIAASVTIPTSFLLNRYFVFHRPVDREPKS